MEEEGEVDCYLAWMDEVKRSRPLTLRAYRDTLSAFVAEYGENWGEVSSDDVTAFITRPRRYGRAPAAATQRRDRVVLNQFFQWMQRSGRITVDPMYNVPSPTVRNRVAKAIADEQWLALWGTSLSTDDRMWLGLGFYAGLRRSEIATISPKAFDLPSQTAMFERKGGSIAPIEYADLARTVGQYIPPLFASSEQWVQIVETVVLSRLDLNLLAPWARGDLSRDTDWINKRLATLLRRAGMAGAFTPHALRHSCATNLMRAGVPIELVADQLSHANLDTTRRYLRTSGQLGRWRQALNTGEH